VLLVAGACSGADKEIRPPDDAILVGAFDFGESEVLAHIYAGALEARGYPVHVLDRVASREIMEPALEQGRVDLVPEYQGTLLRFLDPDTDAGPGGADHARSQREDLAELLEERDMLALEPSLATNSNVIVVTQETAERFDLSTISDLEEPDDELVFGGPPECPSRPLCLLGLEDTYELGFRAFQPLDAGGPLTLGALLAGEVDVALLFETDPDISGHDLVILRDDRHLQPAENVMPVLRQEVLDEHGEGVTEILDEISAAMTTEDLRGLNSRIDDEAVAPVDAAEQWLDEEGLA
jgi:osmoprotectant transport system substrate-binding protein